MRRRSVSQAYLISSIFAHLCARPVLNIFFVRAFAEYISKPFAVVPVAATPAYCISDFRRNLPLSVRFIARVLELLIGRTAEEGARQIVWGALGPDGRDGPHVRYAMSGSYTSLATVQRASEYVVSQAGYEAQERLWVSTFCSGAVFEPLEYSLPAVARDH